ncbi:uncharacterized protein [Typha latifolia]|uniref:uncharacterized protein n=1 Tax=Typha latifolia TaxID=4733 RepID=UPI003C2FFFD0
MESEEFGDEGFPNRSEGDGIRPIHGMESVIATVSGYHGTERFKLIKLIAQTGASYVGAMSKSTTHLVCWKFEGKKHNLARSIGAHVISHRWFEDCLKEGKCLPEGPYTTQSGQETGPILWEMPVISDAHGKKKCTITIEHNVTSAYSNASGCSKAEKLEARSSDIGFSSWSDSHILKMSCERPGKPSYNSSLRLPRQKRSMCDVQNDINGEPSKRVRRLVKKTNSNKCCRTESFDQLESTHLESADVYSLRNVSYVTDSLSQETTLRNNFDHRSSRVLRQEQVGEKEELQNNPVSDNSESSWILRHNASADEITSRNEHNEHRIMESSSCDLVIDHDRKSKVGNAINESASVQRQAELSCVICWTDFSSTRGVLPCGHRFCYSCIQGWADSLASRSMVSTCPLCKASFTKICLVEADSMDQKIYSQTIPCGSSNMDVFMLIDKENDYFQTCSSDFVCYKCHNREPEDLLVSCHICQSQWVHSYCLDPPLIPWTCIHCRDLRMLYQRFH